MLDPRSATLDLKYNDVSNPSAVKDVEYDTLGKDFQIHKAFGQTQTLVKVMKEKQQHPYFLLFHFSLHYWNFFRFLDRDPDPGGPLMRIRNTASDSL